MTRRRALLTTAADLVDGDRNTQYGDPNGDFAATAALWTVYTSRIAEANGGTLPAFRAHDVAAMMALLKISRIGWSPTKEDHWTDLAGYAACGWDCVTNTPTEVTS